MAVIIIQLLGAIVFLVGTASMDIRIRRVSEKTMVERASRICHLLFWSCLVLPGLVGLLYPGITHYDSLLGAPPLPFRPVAFLVGLLLLLAGSGLVVGSNRSLIKPGSGTAAFLLTRRVVSRQAIRADQEPHVHGLLPHLRRTGLNGWFHGLVAWRSSGDHSRALVLAAFFRAAGVRNSIRKHVPGVHAPSSFSVAQALRVKSHGGRHVLLLRKGNSRSCK